MNRGLLTENAHSTKKVFTLYPVKDKSMEIRIVIFVSEIVQQIVKWPEMTGLEIMIAKQTVVILFLCEYKVYGAGKAAFWLFVLHGCIAV